LKQHNPHMKLDWVKISYEEVHLFDVWLWNKLSFYIDCNIKSTMVETTNDILKLKGRSIL